MAGKGGFPSPEEPEAASVSMTPQRKLRMGRIMFMAGDTFLQRLRQEAGQPFKNGVIPGESPVHGLCSFWRLELLLQIIQPIRNARTPSPATLRGVEMPLSSVWAVGLPAAEVSWA